MELVAELDGGSGLEEWAVRLSRYYDWLDIPDSPMGKPGPHSLLAACTLQARHGLRVIPHVRLYDVTYTGFKAIAKTLAMTGIRRVVVLRGDPPRRGSRVEDLAPEEAMEILRSKAPQVEVGLLLSMRKEWSMIEERLDQGPDFVLVLHYRAKGWEGMERLAREASRRDVKLIPYLVVTTRRNVSITSRLGNHSLVDESRVPEEAARLGRLVEGILFSAPGDLEALWRIAERLTSKARGKTVGEAEY
ncbi:MAG: methylenetetrahydrofolate reductase [Desulfurococcales archaeon]|nr:methylenetetrahydrofolate reductase [Desulfurococcales archaeon]